MGNNCVARAENSKSPIDRIIGRCAQICPANEAKSNYWKKYVLETGPPHRSQPHSLNDGWRKVTLTVPNEKTADDSNFGETPVAPPRRKRSSVIDRQPCGFKELFGNNVSRRSSCDSILKEDNLLSEREQDMLQQKRKSKSISDFNLNEMKTTDGLAISTIRIPVTRTLSLMERSVVQQTTTMISRPTLQRKVSRVGNKKSDKFFGENLSDCLSDDPITPEPEPTNISFTYHTISTLITPIPHTSIDGKDKLDEFIDSNISTTSAVELKSQKSSDANKVSIQIAKPIKISERIDSKPLLVEDKKSSLDKKAEFLMAMLEGNNSYKIAEEPKSPPRRSYSKKRNSQTWPIESINNQENDIDKKIITDYNTDAKKINKVQNSDEDDEYYKGMSPVEEQLIVPRKRPTKHICDDDDHPIHKHKHKLFDHIHVLPKKNKKNEQNQLMKDEDIEKYIIAQTTNSPEKPKRDFSVYEKPNQEVNVPNQIKITAVVSNKPVEIRANSTKPIPRVRHLSQENLMAKKLLTSKSNDTIDLLRIKTTQNGNLNLNKLSGDERTESILKKYTSQQSFFTQELLSQIADRVYGFQDPFDTLETCGDDGSLKCTPNSKLTTRKISAHRKQSNVTRPILEEKNVLEIEHEISSVEIIPNIVQIEQITINNSSLHESEILPNERKEFIGTENSSALENGSIFIDEQTKRNTEYFICMERNNSEVCDRAETTHFDDHGIVTGKHSFASLSDNHSRIKNEVVSDEIKLVSDVNYVLDDTYKNRNTILNEFQKNLNNNCDKSENLNNTSDDENTDSDITVKEVPVVEPTELEIEHETKTVLQVKDGGKKSNIVEVDAWFLKHYELSNLSRRFSETNVGYDIRKVFPFGKSDPGAGSEFFETKTLSKSADNMLNDDAIIKTELTTTDQNGNKSNETPSTTDHSILLKYLK